MQNGETGKPDLEEKKTLSFSGPFKKYTKKKVKAEWEAEVRDCDESCPYYSVCFYEHLSISLFDKCAVKFARNIFIGMEPMEALRRLFGSAVSWEKAKGSMDAKSMEGMVSNADFMYKTFERLILKGEDGITDEARDVLAIIKKNSYIRAVEDNDVKEMRNYLRDIELYKKIAYGEKSNIKLDSPDTRLVEEIQKMVVQLDNNEKKRKMIEKNRKLIEDTEKEDLNGEKLETSGEESS